MEFPRSELATELVISFFSQSIQQWAWNDEEYENICNYKDVCCMMEYQTHLSSQAGLILLNISQAFGVPSLKIVSVPT